VRRSAAVALKCYYITIQSILSTDAFAALPARLPPLHVCRPASPTCPLCRLSPPVFHRCPARLGHRYHAVGSRPRNVLPAFSGGRSDGRRGHAARSVFLRFLAHLCAPVFVLLTGISAWLYGDRAGSRAATAAFLAKRGLFLIVLEIVVVNFAWTFAFPPSVIYLQVIWVIGLSMLALAALLWLPRPVVAGVGLVLVAGHNLLDSVHFAQAHWAHIPWAILHDRGWIEVSDALRLRTSYPLLPWIGVITLGYAAGPWFHARVQSTVRQRGLLYGGLGVLAAFIVLRAINGYGQAQKWGMQDDTIHTLMSFLNVTKYPPSLMFLLLTLGLGLVLLALMERAGRAAWIRVLCVFGAAPMFFYLLHLYVLKALYLACVAIWGLNQGDYFGVSGVPALWIISILLAAALFVPVRWYGQLKARRRDITWLKYL